MEDYIKLEGIFEQGYGFIAKKVMQDTALPLATKGFYAYLCSFGGKGNDIFPSRKKICADLDISNDTLSKYIGLLTEKGYIQTTSSRAINGQFCRNTYKIMLTPCPKKPYTEKTDTEKLDTNNNNINNNNNNNKMIKEYENEIGLMTPFQLEKLQSYLDDFSEEMIIEAIHIASMRNAKSLSYVEAILKQWMSAGIKTKADIKEIKKENKKKEDAGSDYLQANGVESFDYLYEN